MPISRIFDLLNDFSTELNSEKTVLASRYKGVWTKISGKEYVEMADLLSLGFLEKGIRNGVKVATIMKNCPEWNFIDMALLQVGAIQVPVYQNVSDASYQFIFKDAQVEYVFVSSAFYAKIKKVTDKVPTIKAVYVVGDDENVTNWQEILRLGQESKKSDELTEIKNSIQETDLATLIYTSGTTGTPKGVMLSHKNIVSNFMGLSHILSKLHIERALSFLPLCHVLERVMNYTFQSHGAAIYYCDNIDHLSDYLRDVQPQMFTAVPRVLEKTFEKIIRKGRSLGRFTKAIFLWAIRVGEKYEPWKKYNLKYRIKLNIARSLVFDQWKKAFGGELQVIVSGGASLQERITHVFWAAGFRIQEGYGLTETSPVVATSNFEPNGVKIGTVGMALPGNEIKIADDGEILVKGPNVMMGYYNRPDLTAEVFDEEGWFHTGDIGVFEDGYLKITDRKKEIFKTSGGKYVSPQQIENKLKESPFIENAIVIGEGRNYTAAIIVPDFAHVESWFKVKGLKYLGEKEVIKDPNLVERLDKEIDTINEQIDHIEQIKRFVLVSDVWNVETGELSPTMKLKRKAIMSKYSNVIEKLYKIG